jgi:hypothetical protein
MISGFKCLSALPLQSRTEYRVFSDGGFENFIIIIGKAAIFDPKLSLEDSA